MNFTTDREKLLGPLQLACGVVERKQTAPILSNLLLDVRENSLTIVGCDEEVEISLVISDIDVESGGAVIQGSTVKNVLESDGKITGVEVKIGSNFLISLARIPISVPIVETNKCDASTDKCFRRDGIGEAGSVAFVVGDIVPFISLFNE